MRRGFTLIELLIVLVIMAAVMTIVIPSYSAMASVQISHAAQDSLRILRYARNMALQTQTPITITFSPGQIRLEAVADTRPQLTYTVAEAEPETSSIVRSGHRTAEVEEDESKPKATSAKDTAAVQGGTIEEIGITRRYDRVAFAFEGYDDTVGEALRGHPADNIDENAGTFSITVRTNGTVRPFTLRIYDRGGDGTGGDLVRFDFLCSGTIDEA